MVKKKTATTAAVFFLQRANNEIAVVSEAIRTRYTPNPGRIDMRPGSRREKDCTVEGYLEARLNRLLIAAILAPQRHIPSVSCTAHTYPGIVLGITVGHTQMPCQRWLHNHRDKKDCPTGRIVDFPQ